MVASLLVCHLEHLDEKSLFELDVREDRIIIIRAKEPRRHIPLTKCLKKSDGNDFELT